MPPFRSTPACLPASPRFIDQRESLSLSGEQARLLELTTKSFIRTGAQARRGRSRAICRNRGKAREAGIAIRPERSRRRERIIVLALDEADLSGVPADVKAAAAQAASDCNAAHPFALTLSRSSVEPFLSHAHRRDLREELFNAWIARGEHDGATDNRPLVAEILALRQRDASNCLAMRLSPITSWSRRWPAQPKAALDLLDKVWSARASQGGQRMRRPCRRWPIRKAPISRSPRMTGVIIAEKLRLSEYAIDQSELSGYFQLENMIEAAFYCAERLFGLHFAPRPDLTGYHPDVRVFEVLDRERRAISRDFPWRLLCAHSASGPAHGCRIFAARKSSAGEVRPIIVNVMNFSKPSAGPPDLADPDRSHDPVPRIRPCPARHVVQCRLSLDERNVHADRFRRISVAALRTLGFATGSPAKHFALHYETGAPIPPQMIDRVIAARHFNQGFATVEFCGSAYVDFLLHSQRDPPKDDIETAEQRDSARYRHAVADRAAASQRRISPISSPATAMPLAITAIFGPRLWTPTASPPSRRPATFSTRHVAARLRDYVYSAGNQPRPQGGLCAFSRTRAPIRGAPAKEGLRLTPRHIALRDQGWQ